jgi:16S rRNA (cytosine967-C5)-methyltransferase
MSIRVNPQHSTLAYQRRLERVDIQSKTSILAPQALILAHPVNVNDLPDFQAGTCYVQDVSAQLAANLLAPKNNERILDACCAPGGKTTHLCELAPKAHIIALDNDEKRLLKVAQNAQRLNINNLHISRGNAQHQDWWDGLYFDQILLDAPCSATGVIRRHPDIKLLRKPKDITALVALQKQILNNLWTLLKPNGILLYATCSILKAENELQIADFLSTHQDAQAINIDLDWGIQTSIGKQQLPNGEFDGFYYAKLRKNPVDGL